MNDHLLKLGDTLNERSRKMLDRPIWMIFTISIVATVFWLVQSQTIEMFVARTGSSPLHWIYASLDPVINAIDWPTGARNQGKSLPLHIYRLASLHTDFDLFTVMKFYMAMEVIAIFTATFVFFRTFSPNTEFLNAALYALIISLTAFAFMNLARFGYPFIWGLYYTLAASARLLGLTFIINNRPWAATVFLGLGLLIHPVMGIFAVIAGFVILLYRQPLTLRSYLFPAAVVSVPILGWILLSFANDQISGGGIPAKDWFFLTKTFNAHWYPAFLGVFDRFAGYHWLPTLSLMLVYTCISMSHKRTEKYIPEVHILVITFAVITAAGLTISYFEVSPFLIKLSLHRASDLMVIVAFVPVLIQLLEDFRNGAIIHRVLSLLLLTSPLVSLKLPGFPAIIALLYCIPFLRKIYAREQVIYRVIPIGLWVITLGFLLKHLVFVGTSNVTGLDQVKSMYSHAGLWLAPALTLLLFPKRYPWSRSFVLLICVSAFIVNLHMKNSLQFRTAKTFAVHDMQIWARNNTPKDALFMLDPGSYGGWRDISRRASFGTVREWLHNAWLYNSDYRLYKEGLRRLGLLGISLDEIYPYGSRLGRIRALLNTAKVRYYTANPTWFHNISKNEGVNYFVFEKRFLKDAPDGMKRVYDNKYFSVYAPVYPG